MHWQRIRREWMRCIALLGLCCLSVGSSAQNQAERVVVVHLRWAVEEPAVVAPEAEAVARAEEHLRNGVPRFAATVPTRRNLPASPR